MVLDQGFSQSCDPGVTWGCSHRKAGLGLVDPFLWWLPSPPTAEGRVLGFALAAGRRLHSHEPLPKLLEHHSMAPPKQEI